MAPRRKLPDNEKDAIAQTFDEDDFRRHWVAGDHGNATFLSRNTSDNVHFNRQDNGFQHLNLTPAEPQFLNDIPDPPAAFKIFSAKQEVEYLNAAHTKLLLAKAYILKEKELGLDPDRPGMHKEHTAILLGKEPIKIDMYAQQHIRLLIDSGAELKQIGENTSEEQREETEKMMAGEMRDYWMFYTSLVASLAWQVPGRNEEDKMAKADAIVENVLGKLVDF